MTDWLVVMSLDNWEICAREGLLVRVAGPVRHLDRSPWRARGAQRFEFARPIALERSLALPARDLLKTMSFAGRPPVWGMKLLDAPLRLTADDVARLEGATGR